MTLFTQDSPASGRPSNIPEIKDFTFLDGGWAVEWRSFTASYVDSPGGEAKQVLGTVLGVYKKLPDGSLAQHLEIFVRRLAFVALSDRLLADFR